MYELLGFLSRTKISYSVKINFGPKFDQFVPVLYFCHHVYRYQAYQQLNIGKLYSFCTYLLVSFKLSFMALRISLKITKPLSQIGLELYSTCFSDCYRILILTLIGIHSSYSSILLIILEPTSVCFQKMLNHEPILVRPSLKTQKHQTNFSSRYTILQQCASTSLDPESKPQPSVSRANA